MYVILNSKVVLFWVSPLAQRIPLSYVCVCMWEGGISFPSSTACCLLLLKIDPSYLDVHRWLHP